MLIDTGSEKSCIWKRTAKNLDIKPLREEVVTHSLLANRKADHFDYAPQ